MKKKIAISVLLVMLLVVCLTACNNTTFKQSAVSGAETDSPVENNGGLVVKQGKHIYYINAYLGADAANDFGDQTKTCLMRAEVDAAGNIVEGSQVVMVPKNIYSASTKSGIYIYNGWIYYATPNVEKDRSGSINTVYLDFYRTSIDRTQTQRLFTINNRSADFRFTDNGKIIVIIDGAVNIIDLNKKRLKQISDEDNFVQKLERASSLTPILADNSFGSYSFVLQSATTAESYKGYNSLCVLDGNGDAKTIITTGSYSTEYTIAISDYVVESDGLTLYYTKTYTDDIGASRVILCCYKFADTNFEFSAENEKVLTDRYSGNGVKGISFEKGAVVSYAAAPYAAIENGTRQSICSSTLARALSIKYVDGDYVYYTNSSSATAMFRMKMFTEADPDDRVEEKVCDLTLSTSWLAPDFMGGFMYYIDSTTGYLFRVQLGRGNEPQLVGVMTAEDKAEYEDEEE